MTKTNFLPLIILTVSILFQACGGKETKPRVTSIKDKSETESSVSSEMTKIHWVTFEEAQELMKTEPRKVLVDVYTEWCGPCKMMMRNTFSNPVIIEYINNNYYAVKWNAEGSDTVVFKGNTFTNPGFNPNRKGRNATHDLTKAIAAVDGKLGYPTTVFIDSKWNLITGIPGYLEPKRIEPILQFIKDDEFAKGTDFPTYQSTFQSKL